MYFLSIFFRLIELLISRGCRGMITTSAFLHCGCAESPDVIWSFVISSVELCSTLFVPPRMETYFIQPFLEKFKLLSHHSMF